MATQPLPMHVASKDIPSVDEQGRPVTVPGIKLEMFIFDSFAFASEAIAAFAVKRSEEFSAVNIHNTHASNKSNNVNQVKNKSGPDSPATAVRDIR